jgi:DNA repair exonuclease SbcCD ATPase subunit
MTNLTQQFNSLKSSFDQKQGMLQAFCSRLNVCQGQINELERKEDLSTKTSLFLQSLSDITRINVLDKISGIVTEALQVVKDKNLEFRMNLSTERNAADLKMVVYDKQLQAEFDVIDSLGGGICDIISFALRVSLLVKWAPSLSRIIVADEVFKHVSVKDQEKVAEFIKLLCKKLNLQLILVSHSETITRNSSKVFEVTKIGSTSKVEEKINV